MIKTNLRPSDVFDAGTALLLIMFLLVVPVVIGLGSIALGIYVGNFELTACGQFFCSPCFFYMAIERLL